MSIATRGCHHWQEPQRYRHKLEQRCGGQLMQHHCDCLTRPRAQDDFACMSLPQCRSRQAHLRPARPRALLGPGARRGSCASCGPCGAGAATALGSDPTSIVSAYQRRRPHHQVRGPACRQLPHDGKARRTPGVRRHPRLLGHCRRSELAFSVHVCCCICSRQLMALFPVRVAKRPASGYSVTFAVANAPDRSIWRTDLGPR